MPALQHRAPAWIARLQAAGARGLHSGASAGGPATPTGDAARAGAAAIIALTIKLDPSAGADKVEIDGTLHMSGSLVKDKKHDGPRAGRG